MSKGIGLKAKRLNKQQQAMADVNDDWCRKEKYYRMFGDCASHPLRFRNGIVEVKIRMGGRAANETNTKRENLTRGLMRNWIRAYPNAKGYRAYICQSHLPDGFTVPASKLYNDEGKPDPNAVSGLAAHIRQIMSTEPVDRLIEIREWPTGAQL